MSDNDATNKVDKEPARSRQQTDQTKGPDSRAAVAKGSDRRSEAGGPGQDAKSKGPGTASTPSAAPTASASSGAPTASTGASSAATSTPSAPASGQSRKPQIGDSRPAPAAAPGPGGSASSGEVKVGDRPEGSTQRKRRRRRGKGGGGGGSGQAGAASGDRQANSGTSGDSSSRNDGGSKSNRSGSGRSGSGEQSSNRGSGGSSGSGGSNRSGGSGGSQKSAQGKGPKNKRPARPEPVELVLSDDDMVELDEKQLKKRGGRSRKGRAVGRYQMNVHVGVDATQISILEGRALIEHYVSRPSDDTNQIHGNIYVGRVENVLPGMEAAFIDIATPKNAVLYRGDVQYDPEDVLESGEAPRIEDVLKPKQLILCQVTKNPIAHKGARLTQEVSLAGRFVVLVPNSKTYGISKRLPDDERKRLRKLLDRVKPAEHGIIVRTAASGVTTEEVERDIIRLLDQWTRIEELATQQTRPGLIYREPEMAVRFIREEFNSEYRAVLIDDQDLHQDISDYVDAVAPALSDRVKLYDPAVEALSLFDRFHISEQLTKALDRKVWLPSGGSLIIEATEALTVIDVNTGRNVGSSSLEETVFKNNLEAADEIARQLRLRDIGGIIVIDFIDMEIKENRDAVVKRFRESLSRDKTRTQVFNISDLGLVEMTRKRIGEGLLETVASLCETCDGRGRIIPPEFSR